MISNKAQESSYTAVLPKTSIFKKFLPKLAKGTMYCLNICMEKMLRCQSEVFGMIINRKARRTGVPEQSSTNRKIICDWPKWSSKDSMDDRKCAMGADFPASPTHNDCVHNSRRQFKNHGVDVQRNCMTNCDESYPSNICKISRSNVKDVYCFTYCLYILLTISLYLITKFYLKLKSY